MDSLSDCLDVAIAIESTGTRYSVLPTNSVDSIHVYKLYVRSE